MEILDTDKCELEIVKDKLLDQEIKIKIKNILEKTIKIIQLCFCIKIKTLQNEHQCKL